MPLQIPAGASFQVIDRVKPALLDETPGKTEWECGIVHPLAGFEVVRPPADHPPDRPERPRLPGLDRRTEGVTDGQAEQATAVPLDPIHDKSS